MARRASCRRGEGVSDATDLNAAVIQLGTYRGGFLWRNNSGATKIGDRYVRFGKKGSGDIIGVYHGYFVSLETKTPNDEASKEQLQFAVDIEAHGGFACFVRDIDDAIEFFERIDKHEAERNGAQVIPF
jgi:hypothetical protein